MTEEQETPEVEGPPADPSKSAPHGAATLTSDDEGRIIFEHGLSRRPLILSTSSQSADYALDVDEFDDKTVWTTLYGRNDGQVKPNVKFSFEWVMVPNDVSS